MGEVLSASGAFSFHLGSPVGPFSLHELNRHGPEGTTWPRVPEAQPRKGPACLCGPAGALAQITRCRAPSAWGLLTSPRHPSRGGAQQCQIGAPTENGSVEIAFSGDEM